MAVPKLVGSCCGELFFGVHGYGVLLQASGQEVDNTNKFIDGTEGGGLDNHEQE